MERYRIRPRDELEKDSIDKNPAILSRLHCLLEQASSAALAIGVTPAHDEGGSSPALAHRLLIAMNFSVRTELTRVAIRIAWTNIGRSAAGRLTNI